MHSNSFSAVTNFANLAKNLSYFKMNAKTESAVSANATAGLNKKLVKDDCIVSVSQRKKGNSPNGRNQTLLRL